MRDDVVDACVAASGPSDERGDAVDTGDPRPGRPDVGFGTGVDASSGEGRPDGGSSDDGSSDDGRSDGAAGMGPRSYARLAAGLAGLAALAVLGLAIADPAPSRHLRGLLVSVDLVCLAGVAAAWLRVVLVVGAPGMPKRIE